MGQSYQTLHPVNETPISSVYERLPQLMARGFYYDLPFNANLNILGQYDQFHWPVSSGTIFHCKCLKVPDFILIQYCQYHS